MGVCKLDKGRNREGGMEEQRNRTETFIFGKYNVYIVCKLEKVIALPYFKFINRAIKHRLRW